MKLTKILADVLKEEVTVSKTEKKNIRNEVETILQLSKMEFDASFIEIRAPKKINSLHIDLPVVPSDKAKTDIIKMMKKKSFVPDGNDAISSKANHRMMSMSFKAV